MNFPLATTMNFPFENQSFFLFIALLMILYNLLRISGRNKRKCKNPTINIPEPSGACPLIGHLHLLLGQDPLFKKFSAMAEELGPIFSVKIGFFRLVVASNPEAVKECFTTNDRVLANRPNIAVGEYIGYNNAIFSLAPYGHYWREMRKISTVHLFSNQRLEMMEYIRESEVKAFIKYLYLTSTLKGQIVDISKTIEFLTFNIILRKIVGKRIEVGEEESDEWRYKKAIKETEYLAGVFMLCDAIPWLKWMDFVKVGLMKKTGRVLDTFLTKWLEEHLQRRSRKGNDDEVKAFEREKSFMDLLLDILPEDVVISGHTRDTIVKSTALILTLTGADSTSITLTWALSLLLNNRAALKAALEELDMNVGKERWVEETDITNLKYLQAIVKETLRLYPPSPFTGIREATEDCYISGYRITRGTRLLVNIRRLHRDPRVWQEPDKFEPERFLSGKPETTCYWDRTGFEYIPFSTGRRNCPGFNFGLRVVHLALARLLQGFEIETVTDKPVDMTEGPGLAMPKVKPLEVVVLPRLKPELYECL